MKEPRSTPATVDSEKPSSPRWNNLIVALLLFVARRVVGAAAVLLSRTQSALGRTQTRLLTRAQARGWFPESEEEANRLLQRQWKLFEWKMERQKKQLPAL